jgi:hypothetical protein
MKHKQCVDCKAARREEATATRALKTVMGKHRLRMKTIKRKEPKPVKPGRIEAL